MDNIKSFRGDLAPAPEFPVKPLSPAQIGNGIIVRVPNWLGDAIMAVPAIMQLKKIIPSPARLFVLCPPGLAAVFECLSCVDQVVKLSGAHKNWTREDRRTIRALGAGAAVLFNNSPRDVIGLRFCGINNLYGTSVRGRGILLRRAFKFPKRRDHQLNNLHHTSKYLSMVMALGAPDWDGTPPEFVLPRGLDEVSGKVREICRKDKLMTLAAGAAYGGSKRWSSENFRAVSQAWIDDGGFVAVLGTGGEKAIGDEVVAGLPPDKAVNMCGQSDIIELMHLLLNSEICVANDSGIMHLSAALGRKGIAVFGPTDPSSTSPISSRWKILFEKQPCSPCFKRECPRGRSNCMKAIAPEKVISAIKELCG